MSDTTIHGTVDPRFARVRETFAEGFRTRDEIGAAVAVTIDGVPVVDLWAGHADLARTRPWAHDTIVNVYSTTKGMAALCSISSSSRAASIWTRRSRATGPPSRRPARTRCRCGRSSAIALGSLP